MLQCNINCAILDTRHKANPRGAHVFLSILCREPAILKWEQLFARQSPAKAISYAFDDICSGVAAAARATGRTDSERTPCAP